MGTNQHPWPAREMRTNQNSTPNPSPEVGQSDTETPIFRIFRARIPYISNVTQSSGLLPIAAASVWWEPQLELGNKNSLAFASDRLPGGHWEISRLGHNMISHLMCGFLSKGAAISQRASLSVYPDTNNCTC